MYRYLPPLVVKIEGQTYVLVSERRVVNGWLHVLRVRHIDSDFERADPVERTVTSEWMAQHGLLK